MQISRNVSTTRSLWQQWRKAGETVAFVPTMGNLHAGHLSLVELAKQHCDRVVVSIFVNPRQFAPGEDFDAYPRTFEADRELLQALDVDMLFAPTTDTIYPDGEHDTCFVEVPGVSDMLEGEFRPGFFRGVATVVLKLFNIVQPDVAVFGEKDYQQLLIIRRMVAELNLPIEIIAGRTMRERDGLAMSSRNGYLDERERDASVALSRALQHFREDLLQEYSNATEGFSLLLARLEAEAVLYLQQSGFVVDYFTLRDAGDLSTLENSSIRNSDDDPDNTQEREVVVLTAARLGSTRLIDNLRFTLENQLVRNNQA
jgi:pantoate--beta-alanine ligase